MILEHVAHDADAVVERAAVLDADRLGDGDLHVIDVVAVPDRLEDAVGEAEDQDVLDGLLAQVVVDAVDLLLGQHLMQQAVEFPRRSQIGAEGFLDDHAPPSGRPVDHPGSAQPQHDVGVHVGRGGQVVQAVGRAAVGAFGGGQDALQVRQGRGVGRVAAQILELCREGRPGGGVGRRRLCASSSARKAALSISLRAMPTRWKPDGRRPLRCRLKSAGTSLREVRSPEAPKITIEVVSVMDTPSLWPILAGNSEPLTGGSSGSARMPAQMRERWMAATWFVAGAVLTGSALFGAYQIPWVKGRLEWRLDAAAGIVAGWLHPGETLPTPAHAVAEFVTPTPLATSPTPTLPEPDGTPQPTSTPLPASVSLPAPAWEKQDWNNCGPATLTLAMRYFGWDGDQRDISGLLKPDPGDKNVNIEELAYYVRTRAGWLNAEYRVGADRGYAQAVPGRRVSGDHREEPDPARVGGRGRLGGPLRTAHRL